MRGPPSRETRDQNGGSSSLGQVGAATEFVAGYQRGA